MIVVYCLISLWLGAVIGYAMWRSRPWAVKFEEVHPIGHASAISYRCLHVIARGLDDRRPVAWWMRRKWRVLPEHMWRRGTTAGPDWVVLNFSEDVDVDNEEILADDPNGKFEAAAIEVLRRLRLEHVGAFVDMPMIHGLDFCCKVADHETNVRLRLIRGFDIQNMIFITRLDVAALVATKVLI